MAKNVTWASRYEKRFDPEQCLRDYFTSDSEITRDSVLQPMHNLHKFFTSGSLNVDTFIFYGATHNIHLLFPICDYVKEIIIIDFLNKNMDYLEKWMNKDPESFNWSDSIKSLYEFEEERANWMKNEDKARKLIKKCIKSDLSEKGPVAPQGLAQTDCLLSSYCLTYMCQDINSFIASVKSMSSLLKVGGHLLLHVFLNCTYIMVGKYKFPILNISEELVINTLTNLGFSIKEVQRNPRDSVTTFSLIDFSSILFVAACKECEVEQSKMV